MKQAPRTPFEIYSEALHKLDAESGPLTQEKATLIRFLRKLITDYEPMHRLVSSPGHAPKRS